MTNRERYQRSFSTLQPSRAWNMEEPNMKPTKRRLLPRFILVTAVVVLVMAMMATAYAANVGGIQRTIQVWLHGDQTAAVLDIQNGEYTLTYTDENGEEHQQMGGGKAFDIFGNEREMTEQELLQNIDMPDVEYLDDGTVWIYYHGSAVEITDRFDDDGICYVQVSDGSKTLYVTVKYDNGYGFSESKYPNPHSFN